MGQSNLTQSTDNSSLWQDLAGYVKGIQKIKNEQVKNRNPYEAEPDLAAAYFQTRAAQRAEYKEKIAEMIRFVENPKRFLEVEGICKTVSVQFHLKDILRELVNK